MILRCIIRGAMIALPWLLPAALIPTAAATDLRAGEAMQERTSVDSLDLLSIPSLRQRTYRSTLHILKRVDVPGDTPEPGDSREALRRPLSVLASYDSGGLRVYTRIDVPILAPPATGYRVVVFVHGWQGIDAAPGHDFGYSTGSQQTELIAALVDAGYLVLSPGLRGHGTVDGQPAEGIEFLAAWDNATYLSPVFYAMDLLNLIGGLPSIATAGWSQVGIDNIPPVDSSRVHVIGHSQGADAVLMALAISGEGSQAGALLGSGSLWSGCFGGRFEQAELYGPMATTTEAFLSGDGTWTGNAIGRDGRVNPEFRFGWPPDWISTVDVHSPEWSWQANIWHRPSVANALEADYAEMYAALASNVSDIEDPHFELFRDASGRTHVRHDKRIAAGMAAIGGAGYPQFLKEPLLLHHSDRDYYSPPEWNSDLARRVNAVGGTALDFTYPGNDHSLRISQHRWFRDSEAHAGFPVMIARELAFLRGADPAAIGNR